MSISPRLSRYLEQHGARYDIFVHPHSSSSAETARTAHVPPHQLAKSVLLEDDQGYVMAVVPADQSVMLGELDRILGRKGLRLSDENHIALLFSDCEPGAVPAIGAPWGIETVVEDHLGANDVVFLEGGDQERLLRMTRSQFDRLMTAVRRGHFCRPRTH